jgi:hypothetical protein
MTSPVTPVDGTGPVLAARPRHAAPVDAAGPHATPLPAAASHAAPPHARRVGGAGPAAPGTTASRAGRLRFERLRLPRLGLPRWWFGRGAPGMVERLRGARRG